MPKLIYYRKKGEHTALEDVEGEKSNQKIWEAIRTTKMHMTLLCIAMGILQDLSVCFIGEISPGQLRYQRTPSIGRASEAAIMDYLRKYFSTF